MILRFDIRPVKKKIKMNFHGTITNLFFSAFNIARIDAEDLQMYRQRERGKKLLKAQA